MKKSDRVFTENNSMKKINLKPYLLALVIVSSFVWWLVPNLKYEFFSKQVAEQAIQVGSIRVDKGLLDSPVFTKIVSQAEVVKRNIDTGNRDPQGFLTKIDKSLDDNFDWQINLVEPHYNQNVIFIHSDYWDYDGVIKLDPIPNGVKLFRNRYLSWEAIRSTDGHIYYVPLQVDLSDFSNFTRVWVVELLIFLGRFLLLWFLVRLFIEVSAKGYRFFCKHKNDVKKFTVGLLEEEIERILAKEGRCICTAREVRIDQMTVVYLFGSRGILLYPKL